MSIHSSGSFLKVPSQAGRDPQQQHGRSRNLKPTRHPPEWAQNLTRSLISHHYHHQCQPQSYDTSNSHQPMNGLERRKSDLCCPRLSPLPWWISARTHTTQVGDVRLETTWVARTTFPSNSIIIIRIDLKNFITNPNPPNLTISR